ncbi:MAG: host attachment protein [Spirochaetia bacterium]|nr:host attachment protein [Spirochaetia bacterium]
MGIKWIMAANAAEAKLYKYNRIQKDLDLIEIFKNDDMRKKGRDIETDRQGSSQDSHGFAKHGYSKEKSFNDIFEETFAQNIIQTLEKHLAANEFEEIIIAMSPHFLGKFRKKISANLSKAVKQEIAKDLTHFTQKELAEYMQKSYNLI